MKQKRSIISRFYPLFAGVIAFNMLRGINDLRVNNPFWYGDVQSHIVGLLGTILFCYLMDAIWMRRLTRPDRFRSVAKEYLLIFAELFLISNLYLALGTWVGIFFVDSFMNFLLIFVAYDPLLMLYYMLMRDNTINEKYREQLLQLEKIKADQYQTELKFLKAQYHPHFLFNALNTLYFQIDEHNSEAKQSVEQLSAMLRYQLYDIEKEVTLGQEINYMKTYIAFQQQRMSKKLVPDMHFSPELNEQKIHPLLFQPLIENALKYVGGAYRIHINMQLQDTKVLFEIDNSLSELMNSKVQGKGNGVGLENLRRRLELLYPGKYTLETTCENNTFTANLQIETGHGN